MDIRIRLAEASDIPLLRELIRASVRGLQAGDYSAAQMEGAPSVITSKAANDYHFKTGQRDWPSRTENVLLCRLLWWQVGFGTPASGATLEHVAVMQ